MTALMAITIALGIACQACVDTDFVKSQTSKIDENPPAHQADEINQYEETDPEPGPWLVAESMPEFPGGEAALKQCLVAVRPYCDQSGAVKIPVSFTVEIDGSVTGVECALEDEEAMSKTSLCSEAVRKATSMPKWRPGRNDGKVVRVRVTAFVYIID
jgi:protein TonB